MQTSLELIGSREACRILDRDRATLTRYVKDGKLSAVGKLSGQNGAYVFERATVEAFKLVLEPAA